MSIELTKEQQEQLVRETTRPPTIRDPASNAEYVLVPAEQYEQMIEVIENDADQRALRRAAARGLAARTRDEA
jgi:hypothetical protein